MEALPDYVLHQIFEQCETVDRLCIACTSRRFHSIVNPLISYTLQLGYDTIIGSEDGSCQTKRINTRHLANYLEKGVFDIKLKTYMRKITFTAHSNWIRDIQEILDVIKEKGLDEHLRLIEIKNLEFPHRPTIAFVNWVTASFSQTNVHLSLSVRRTVRETDVMSLSKHVRRLTISMSLDELSESEHSDSDSDWDDYDDEKDIQATSFDTLLKSIRIPEGSKLWHVDFLCETEEHYPVSEEAINKFLQHCNDLRTVRIEPTVDVKKLDSSLPLVSS